MNVLGFQDKSSSRFLQDFTRFWISVSGSGIGWRFNGSPSRNLANRIIGNKIGHCTVHYRTFTGSGNLDWHFWMAMECIRMLGLDIWRRNNCVKWLLVKFAWHKKIVQAPYFREYIVFALEYYQHLYVLHKVKFKKKIVSAETIRGNSTVTTC